MTYGNAGSIPMKSLWKNKTELHDMGRMQTFINQLPPKTYVKDWSIPVKKSKAQTNQYLVNAIASVCQPEKVADDVEAELE